MAKSHFDAALSMCLITADQARRATLNNRGTAKAAVVRSTRTFDVVRARTCSCYANAAAVHLVAVFGMTVMAVRKTNLRGMVR